MTKGRTAGAVDNALKRLDIKYEFKEEDEVFLFSMDSENGLRAPYRIVIATDDDKDVISSVCIFPVNADANDAEQISRLGRLIAKINWNLSNGVFKLDHNDGQILCHWYVATDGLETVPTELALGIFTPIGLCNKYGRAITKVLYGGADPDEVNNEVMNQMN